MVDRLRDAIEACPEEEVGGTTQVYELVPGDSADGSFFVKHRYRSDYGFDTGLEVIGVVRLDDLVLLSFEYGEGGGSGELDPPVAPRGRRPEQCVDARALRVRPATVLGT